MIPDEWTFFLAFIVVFAALGYYLWHLERRLDRLEEALRADVDAARSGSHGGAGSVSGHVDMGQYGGHTDPGQHSRHADTGQYGGHTDAAELDQEDP